MFRHSVDQKQPIIQSFLEKSLSDGYKTVKARNSPAQNKTPPIVHEQDN